MKGIGVGHLENMIRHGCQCPGCSDSAISMNGVDVIFLHARCHPKAPTWVSYEKGSGKIRVTCAECDELVVAIEVANDN